MSQRATIAAVLAAAAATCVGSAVAAAPTASWHGLGASLASWERAHPKDTRNCPSGGCYGPPVRVDGRETTQFIEVATTKGGGHRVVGYTQAIGDGTSLSAAKAAVRRLLPADLRTTGYRIAHSHGDSCVLWNVRSATLARLLAGSGADDPKGELGINLNAPTSAGHVFRPGDVSEAAVGTTINGATTTC